MDGVMFPVFYACEEGGLTEALASDFKKQVYLVDNLVVGGEVLAGEPGEALGGWGTWWVGHLVGGVLGRGGIWWGALGGWDTWWMEDILCCNCYLLASPNVKFS